MAADTLETECLIIGGGPAGLTAAIYLARFRRSVVLVDNHQSRARYIKSSHNYPGFTNGIEGAQFLNNLRTQATEYGAVLVDDTVHALQKTAEGRFVAGTETQNFQAQKVIIATGVIDEKPSLPHIQEFIYEGAVRFCPVCDGYEATDKRIGIVGPLDHVIGKALFLRSFSKKIFMLITDHLDFTQEQRQDLLRAGIEIPEYVIADLKIPDGADIPDCTITALLKNGQTVALDILYPAMGARARSELAVGLGAGHTPENCLLANSHQESSVPGLYIAGDVCFSLSQITVATGQAAIAATDIHNKLPRNPR